MSGNGTGKGMSTMDYSGSTRSPVEDKTLIYKRISALGPDDICKFEPLIYWRILPYT